MTTVSKFLALMFGRVRLALPGAVGLLAACSNASVSSPDKGPHTQSDETPQVSLVPIGVFETGNFGSGSSEILAFDPVTEQLFSLNSSAATVDVLDISDPAAPRRVQQVDVSALGAGANSIALAPDARLLAVAIEADPSTEPGHIAFFDLGSLALLRTIPTGALPDMVVFTPDERFLLVANEGEPSDDLAANPEGSISIVDMSGGVASATARTADFRAFNSDAGTYGIRVSMPGASLAEDVEPEYIAVSEDSSTAFVSLQENNAMATVDISRAVVSKIVSLGTIDHSLPGNAFDPKSDDNAGLINAPVFGMRMPDSIATYRSGGDTFIVTANEGDPRVYGAKVSATGEALPLFNDVLDVDTARAAGLIDEAAFTAADLAALGELEISVLDGDTDGDGDLDRLFSFGSRSFSIFAADGSLVFDSGNLFETITAARLPAGFNSDNDENDSFDTRSRKRGPEPEGIAVGNVDGISLAFIGLERVGGVMVFDISDPANARFQDYVNMRDFSVDALSTDKATTSAIGDLGPEGLTFISSTDSPTGTALLAVGNEVSGTVRIFKIVTETTPG